MIERVEIGLATLYRGDALAVLAEQADSSIDCVITDPPYCAGAISEAQRTRAPGQGIRSENIKRFGWFTGDNMGTAGLVWLLRAMAFECVRVVKPTGSLLIFCDWRMISALQPAIESAGMRFQGLLVWDKGAMGMGAGFRCQHELILHFTFGAPEYHNLGTANVIHSGRVRPDEREHQAQKPVDLLTRLARVVCPPGGTIADMFMGSGSTGVAAVESGYRFVGAERGDDEFAIARRRIEDAQRQGSLFDTPSEASA